MGQIAQMLHEKEVSVIFATINDRLSTYRVRFGFSWFDLNIVLQFAELRAVDKHSIKSERGHTGGKCQQHS